MKYTARPYQSKNDLYQIGKLIRRAYAHQQCFNAWSFCRFDIWALRRIADAASFNDHSWQEYFQLMHDENENLVGANKLYSACGFVEQDRLYSWKKVSHT